MNLIKVLKRVSLINFFGLLGLGLKNLLFIVPTIRATRKTVATSYELYGKAHHVNGPANAFRHVLWNYQIAKACSQRSKDHEKVLRWTEDITDWHERAFPNATLARLMDLHNNAVGRTMFAKNPNLDEDAIIVKLKMMTEESVLITSERDLNNNKGRLVHIIP